MYSPDTTKYLIHLNLQAEGVVEKPDVVGAIFGQTEGLLGEDLDLRDLQRTGRVGRIDVQISSKRGETKGDILISSSLDRAETAILAASLETIDRVGPCVAHVVVEGIEDIRVTKRRKIVDRAKELLLDHFEDGSIDSYELLDEVREAIRVEKIGSLGDEKIPAGPNVMDSDAIIIVEGRADVINLLKYGIKNAVAVEGTNVPAQIVDLADKKTATAFLDGDRGGELILRELLQVADIDYVAFSPRGKSVEDMARKEIIKALRNKVPVEYVRDQFYGDVPGEKRTQDLRPQKPGASEQNSIKKENVENENESTPTSFEPISEPAPPVTLHDHMERVSGHLIARFLSPEFTILNETRADDVEMAIDQMTTEVSGLVIDRVVDQKLLDRLVGKGVEFVAARDFNGIIKRPLSIRLMKIAQ
ncbi:DNA primase DnaG [Methanosphaerula palustris]|uniref:DNA primase DnaG n=1 Tax=Methanosphaerula palustris (strain ATCC BAA-1556 / DSM 19958 / E1-9c) TaxID=521011 RepID=DNAG_METPE|nr:DNA primase DnaG [Methanosphaerula palustris]B8GFL8.1 RecName: Full=DNA primase DnaG [Methanosphaerula palustris E1-9c]ACL16066.1 TOPRIM domain protein [Methanosphaerula palustris E1-9c]